MCDQREKTQGCPMYTGEITQYIFKQLEITICINVLLYIDLCWLNIYKPIYITK